ADFIKLLIALDQDVTAFVGQDAFAKECTALAAKDKTDVLNIFNFDAMPKVHWASDNTSIPADVLRGWMLMAIKVKDPQGNALFDLYSTLMNRDDLATFATWVFKSWVAEDTRKNSKDYCTARAQEAADDYRKRGRYGGGPATEEDIANLYRAVYNDYARSYLGSGAKTKGVLGLARYGLVDTMAPTASSYMKNHSQRTSQAKAMAEMLASIDDPLMIQILVTCSRKTRQDTVRAEIEAHVERLATARGWDADQLADHVVPTANLDENGVLTLDDVDGGDTPWQVVLLEDLTLVLMNAEAKAVKALPKTGGDGLKEAKSLLKSAKAGVKETVKHQTDRLRDAMMRERTWALEEWQDCFTDHPIMGRMIRRLIWIGLDDGGARILTFRPTADGSFVDADGDDIDLDGVSQVMLAHALHLSDTDREDWAEDQDWVSLFDQAGRPLPVLDPTYQAILTGGADSLNDRTGWCMSAVALTNAALGLGWRKGMAEDGGMWHHFDKPASGDLPAVYLNFGGTPAVREDHDTHLLGVEFDLNKGQTLADLPQVFLNEIWNEYHQLADLGEYRDDWKDVVW
ncbi:MAG: DUF4132 domain-containing protein, partial [Pseudomonadota bacterium]